MNQVHLGHGIVRMATWPLVHEFGVTATGGVAGGIGIGIGVDKLYGPSAEERGDSIFVSSVAGLAGAAASAFLLNKTMFIVGGKAAHAGRYLMASDVREMQRQLHGPVPDELRDLRDRTLQSLANEEARIRQGFTVEKEFSRAGFEKADVEFLSIVIADMRTAPGA